MVGSRSVIPFTFLLSSLLLVACGGGSGSSSSTPLPPNSSPAPVITASQTSVTLVPGESTTVQIATQSDSGGSLSMSLTGVPDGVTASVVPATVTPGQNAALVIATAGNASTNGTITVTARRGSGSATAPVNLNFSGSSPAPTRVLPMRLTGLIQDFVYDSSHKQVFFLDALNQKVGVASTVTGKTLATFNITGAVALDLTPDNSKLYVGTQSDTAAVVVIDAINFQVTAQYPAPPLVRAPVTAVVAALNDVVLSIFGNSVFSLSATGVWHDLDFYANSSQFFRSGDHSRIFLNMRDIAEYDSSADRFVEYRQVPSCTSNYLGSNTTGTRFLCTQWNSTSASNELIVFDEDFNEISRSTGIGGGTPSFSTDGTRVFALDAAVFGAFRVFSVAPAALQGYLSLVFKPGPSTPRILDTDGTAVLVSAETGLFLADAGTLLPSAPVYTSAAAYVNDPIPFDGATQLEFQTDTPNVEGLSLGTKVVTSLTKAMPCGSRYCFRGNVPQGEKPGLVDVFLTHDGGTISSYLGGVSMGPDLVKENIVPRSGSPNSTTSVAIQTYYRPDTYLVVNNQKIQIDNSNFRWIFPAGSPGFATISVFGSSGVNALSKGFFYPNRSEQILLSGTLSDITSNSTHKKIYVSNTTQNRIEVLSSESLASLGTIATGKSPIALSLSPDESKLLVANSADCTIQVIDTATDRTSSTFLFIDPLFPGQQPTGISAVTANKALVRTQYGYVVIDLATGSTGPGHLPGVAALLTNGTVAFANFENFFIWDPALDTTEPRPYRSGQGLVAMANSGFLSTPYIFNNAGQVISKITGLYAGIASNPTALLLYAAPGFGNSGTALDLIDGRTGNVLRTLWFKEGFKAGSTHLALAANGKQVFAITKTGVSMIELVNLPLSVESAEPSTGSGGTTFTLHGTGFTPSTKLSFGNLNAGVSYVDEYTLRVTVPTAAKSNRMFISNADSDEYIADGVFFVK